MKLVVGLGNPGRQYHGTRHNVGFEVLAELARRYGDGSVRAKFHGEFVEANLGGHRVVLLSPLTYMNRSGTSVCEATRFYKIAQEDILVVCDDINLPVAKLRVRPKGSAGGQKGLNDIIQRLATEDFARLRIGVGSPPAGWDWADFVLSKFTKDEDAEIAVAIGRAADAVETWSRDGLEACMNQYN